MPPFVARLGRAVLCALALTTEACASDSPTGSDAVGPTSQTGLWVSAYYAGWYWEWCPPETVDMSTMTHFVFGRYAPGGGTRKGEPGEVVEAAGTGHGPKVEDALVAKAHAAGVRALMMLGGAGDGRGFSRSTADEATRKAFVEALLSKLIEKDYDGVDVDWEENLSSPADRDQLIAFLTELRAAAATKPRYRSPNRPIVITFPGFAVNTNTDLPVPPWKATVASLVDQYNLMTYAQNHRAPGWQTWLFSALKGASPSHPTSVESSIQAYVDAGVPRERLGMGIGLYGRYYYPPVTGPRQPLTAGGGGDDNFDNYRTFHRNGLLDHPSGTYVWDEEAQAGYFVYSPPVTYQKTSRSKPETISMLTTEEARTIMAKGTWARAGNCGGTIVWTINYGTLGQAAGGGNPAMEAVKRAFLTR
jgi:GH18 family chitinase